MRRCDWRRANILRSLVSSEMNAEALALKFKFREAVLGKEREEVAQLLHRELRFRATWLTGLLTVPAPSSITVALRAAACSLRLPGLLLLRAFVSRRL